MVSVVDLFQAFLQDVRVNLSGRDVAVTQHELDRAQIGAPLEQVRRERVPHQVGRNARRNPRRPAVASDDLPEAHPRKRASALVDEQRRHGRILHQLPPLPSVSFEGSQRRFPDRYQALLAPLPPAVYHSEVRLKVLAAQADQLRDPHPRRIEQLEHRFVPMARRRRGVGLLEQRVHLTRSQILGQAVTHLRSVNVAGGVTRDLAPFQEKPKEVAQRNQVPRHGPSTESTAIERLEKAANVLAGSPLRVVPRAAEIVKKADQVTAVARNRIRGQALLDAGVVEELDQFRRRLGGNRSLRLAARGKAFGRLVAFQRVIPSERPRGGASWTGSTMICLAVPHVRQTPSAVLRVASGRVSLPPRPRGTARLVATLSVFNSMSSNRLG